MNSSLKKSGFTLLEVLVVAGIFSFITGASFILLSSSNLSVDIGEAQTQAAENARRGINRISKELRLSQPAHVHLYDSLDTEGSKNSGAVIYLQIPLGSYDDNLVLNPNASVIWGDGDTVDNYIFYCLEPDTGLLFRGTCNSKGSGVLTQQTAFGSEYLFPVIARNISSLSFSRAGTSAELINIEVEGQSQASSRPMVQTLRTSVRLKN